MIAFGHKIHYLFGIAIWTYFYIIGVNLNIFLVFFGSLLPDADIKFSPMGKILPLWLWLNHRGFTHTIPCMLIFSALIYWISDFNSALSLFIGYLSHLILDATTPMGVKWIKGHKRRKRRKKKYAT